MAEKKTNLTGMDGVKIVSRTLPDYNTRKEKWDFMRSSYIGGKTYTDAHLFQYYTEGDDEFSARKQRAHRENHCKVVVDLFNSYLFQEQPTRDTSNERLKAFHENIDGKGKNISQFMKLVSLWSAVFGRAYIMVDKPSLPMDERTGTARDDINPKAQPYAYIVHPQDIRDIAFNEDGSVKWVIIVEHIRDDEDPFLGDGEIRDRFRLWMMSGWRLYDDKGNFIDGDDHGLNAVPMVVVDNEEADQYDGQSLIGDIAYLDRSIFNNWSRLDSIVCDQTFSQLIFPIEGLIMENMINDKEMREKFMAIAHNRILFYSTLAQVPPSWISPDASQADFILRMVESQTTRLYASLGLKAEIGTEVQSESGVAKAWDFDKLDKMLSNKADNLEEAERRINLMFNKWTGDSADCIVDYPEKFDTRSLADEIAMASELALMRISETFTKEIEKMVALKALPKADDATIQKIMDEIDAKDLSDEPPDTPDMDFDEDDDANKNKKKPNQKTDDEEE